MTIGPVFSRPTNLLSSDRLLQALSRTSTAINKTQDEISSGLKVVRPSDDPSRIAAILTVKQQLEARTQYDRNLQHALSVLNSADQALADVSDILVEARSVALSQIGIGSDAETRKAEAAVIDAQLAALIEIANRTVAGVSLFNGSHSGDEEGRAFVSFLGGVKYTGGRGDLNTDAGLNAALPININGADAFNIGSGRIVGQIDLDPNASANTRLADIAGAQNRGVRLGSIVVTVNGDAITVDLSGAKTLGDIATRVNGAIASIEPGAGNLAVIGTGFELVANVGHTISLADSGNGKAASDLGIVLTASGAIVTGGDTGPRLTALTQLSDLGASVDFGAGLQITQGGTTRVADFSGAETVQDLMNVIEQLDLGLSLEVSDDGQGLTIVNHVSGIHLSIGENGGTTADDLGLRTMGLNTRLSDMNDGRGVKNILGEDDFAIELHDGRTFNVNIDGATTVDEVLARINDAATAAGLTVGAGGEFHASLAAVGNGIVLTDGTVGAGNFRVNSLGLSTAAADLGIAADAAGDDTINGEDVAKRRVDSIFTYLIDLHSSLASNDESGITFAESGLEGAIDQIARTRAEVGLRAERAENEQERSTDMGLTEQKLLSELTEADLTEVITRFTQLQTQLQASLQVGAQNLRLSLLDFLR